MKRIALFTAMALAASTAVFTGCNRNESATGPDNRTAGEKTRDAIATAGEKTGDAIGTAVDKTKQAAESMGHKIASTTQPSETTAYKDARTVLSKTVQYAVTRDGLGDVVDQFTKADRDRIGKVDKNSLGDLNAAIDKFRADWKAKYNQDFKISDQEQLVFGAPVEFQFGQVDSARTAAAKQGPDVATGTTAVNPNDKSMNNSPRVSFPANGDLPMARVQLENEGTVMASYKIDVPDSLDATKLRESLTTQINKIDQMKDKWPSDVADAYRAVSQGILSTLGDMK